MTVIMEIKLDAVTFLKKKGGEKKEEESNFNIHKNLLSSKV